MTSSVHLCMAIWKGKPHKDKSVSSSVSFELIPRVFGGPLVARACRGSTCTSELKMEPLKNQQLKWPSNKSVCL